MRHAPSALLLALFAVTTLSSCSPVQGYPGPELPNDQIAVVYFDGPDAMENEVQRVSSESFAFDSDGISLLPGEHEFDSFFEKIGLKKNCIPESHFDNWGYQSCLSRQSRQIRNRKGGWISCSPSQYTTTTYHCTAEITEMDCHFSATLESGKKYDLKIPRDTAAAGTGVFLHKEPRKIGDGECNKLRTHDEQREFKNPR